MKQTGDRYIIQDGDNTYVLMPFDDYAALLNQEIVNSDPVNNMSEEEFLGKINTEIAEWKSTQPEVINQVDFSQELDNKGQEKEEEDQYYLEPVE
ncbi:hypothetical protein COT97_05425 [Candidatus Falkowbacteria bacterium CG10_big_fil_rev_8_21_14_0_10_39_11]|uniref:Uncharacterized protein n=1 Tax=Candidatus Falkowbacteria bacterium CG10_big_fil_rev_8_21_14_0_10_39_11 TaxID=1974565 RepID=A0A2H0V3K9_9BACT|nr:MAG: hypothetical protein COT97_05425 [Candidatus Falkowbacteria bacterium CG10_big_fil_rev_8_21_14_0_10_39_11]